MSTQLTANSDRLSSAQTLFWSKCLTLKSLFNSRDYRESPREQPALGEILSLSLQQTYSHNGDPKVF